MAKPPKVRGWDIPLLIEELRSRGLKVQVFNNQIHWRLFEWQIDFWPTCGRWKWMGQTHSGQLSDFVQYLDKHKATVAAMADVIMENK